MKRKWIFLAPLMIAAFVLVGGSVVMQLWNWLLPTLFGWKEIGFWQALGLLALCRILFGGHGFGGGRPGGGLRRRMAGRWDQMTPEERDKLCRGIRSKAGGFDPSDRTPA